MANYLFAPMSIADQIPSEIDETDFLITSDFKGDLPLEIQKYKTDNQLTKYSNQFIQSSDNMIPLKPMYHINAVYDIESLQNNIINTSKQLFNTIIAPQITPELLFTNLITPVNLAAIVAPVTAAGPLLTRLNIILPIADEPTTLGHINAITPLFFDTNRTALGLNKGNNVFTQAHTRGDLLYAIFRRMAGLDSFYIGGGHAQNLLIIELSKLIVYSHELAIRYDANQSPYILNAATPIAYDRPELQFDALVKKDFITTMNTFCDKQQPVDPTNLWLQQRMHNICDYFTQQAAGLIIHQLDAFKTNVLGELFSANNAQCMFNKTTDTFNYVFNVLNPPGVPAPITNFQQKQTFNKLMNYKLIFQLIFINLQKNQIKLLSYFNIEPITQTIPIYGRHILGMIDYLLTKIDSSQGNFIVGVTTYKLSGAGGSIQSVSQYQDHVNDVHQSGQEYSTILNNLKRQPSEQLQNQIGDILRPILLAGCNVVYNGNLDTARTNTHNEIARITAAALLVPPADDVLPYIIKFQSDIILQNSRGGNKSQYLYYILKMLHNYVHSKNIFKNANAILNIDQLNELITFIGVLKHPPPATFQNQTRDQVSVLRNSHANDTLMFYIYQSMHSMGQTTINTDYSNTYLFIQEIIRWKSIFLSDNENTLQQNDKHCFKLTSLLQSLLSQSQDPALSSRKIQLQTQIKDTRQQLLEIKLSIMKQLVKQYSNTKEELKSKKRVKSRDRKKTTNVYYQDSIQQSSVSKSLRGSGKKRITEQVQESSNDAGLLFNKYVKAKMDNYM